MIVPVAQRYLQNYKVGIRRISASVVAWKGNNKSQFQKLGSVLSKGEVGQQKQHKSTGQEVQSAAPVAAKPNVLEAFVDAHSRELEESSLHVGFMSKDDIKLQEFLDQGRQFGASGSGVMFRRSAAINSLPEQIDVLKTPWEEIERTYRVLRELDNDPAIHHKYKKRLAIDTKSLISVRTKRLVDMCKFARRDQRRQMSALESAFESIYQYNVVGFDRSLGGVPLQTGRHAFPSGRDKEGKEPIFPLEMLEDARPFDTVIPIHKKEVNFMEDDALEETLMPHDIKPNLPERLLLMEGKPIMIDNIDDYNTLEHHSPELKSRIEDEIFNLQRMLSSEVSRSSLSLFHSSERRLKHNRYLLVSKVPLATKYTGPTFKYALKYFDLVPFYGSLLTSVKHYRHLYRHLFKVVLQNLSEQIDSLTRIKYKSAADRRSFMKKTYGQVHHLVNYKLMPMVVNERMRVPGQYDAVVHKQVLSSSFSRIYWLSRRQRSSRRGHSRRQAQVLDVVLAHRL